MHALLKLWTQWIEHFPQIVFLIKLLHVDLLVKMDKVRFRGYFETFNQPTVWWIIIFASLQY